jgi:hypothetical protein
VEPVQPYQLKPVVVMLLTVTLENVPVDDRTVAITIGGCVNALVKVTEPELAEAVAPASIR